MNETRPEEIISIIENLKCNYIVLSTSLIPLNDYSYFENYLKEVIGLDFGSTCRFGRHDDTYYEGIDLHNCLNKVRENPSQFNLEMLGGYLMLILSFVHSLLLENRYLDRSPEMEFLRHIRNGISHGNRFHFTKDEPVRPASFMTFEIIKSLEGTGVLFEYLSTGDVLDLFDYIKLYLKENFIDNQK